MWTSRSVCQSDGFGAHSGAVGGSAFTTITCPPQPLSTLLHTIWSLLTMLDLDMAPNPLMLQASHAVDKNDHVRATLLECQ